ncbi:MAG: hypothetical protein MUC53_12175 [Candidatus Contendobacter sp.]|jgi:hypothetical protein|nr:hypothetical protein [Candidatus Contendobacter sp.]
MKKQNSKPKIIQLILTPNDNAWQGVILGLADDGVTYVFREGWKPYLPHIGWELERESTA